MSFFYLLDTKLDFHNGITVAMALVEAETRLSAHFK
jgi:hypothetical protein